ncbi:MAG TPA: hypothetical protein VMW50_03715 [Dehalococcoidia bacterium]|nr:hypothetical protein [Dehalococcoidia bacterium]
MATELKIPTADFVGGVTLASLLDGMSKEEMIAYADTKMGVKVDDSLELNTIKEKLLIVEAAKKNDARAKNAKSIEMTMALDAKRERAARTSKTLKYEANPLIQVKFHFIQHVGADLEFATSEPYGLSGPVNKYGFKREPSYHLFHGETYQLPLAIVEHLQSKTFMAHKPILDPVTGMQNGSIPIIKPRFILEVKLSRAQYLELGKVKGKEDEQKDIP